jgi:hypothetical protein
MIIHTTLLLGMLNLLPVGMVTQNYDQGKFLTCKEFAQEISGYHGRTPNRYLPGGALEGALKGAATSSGLSWLSGGNKKERKKAAKRGAALGALIGAIKRGEAKRREREKKQEYQRELRRCMTTGN